MPSRVFCLLPFLLAAAAAPPARDTVPPAGRWLSPPAFSVLSTNQVRVAVAAQDDSGGSGMDRVEFFASYFDRTAHFRQREKIGEARRPPYEIIWDCSALPDQYYPRLKFSAVLYDRAAHRQDVLEMPDSSIPLVRGYSVWLDRQGKILQEWHETAPVPWDCFVLDRNPELNPKTLVCPPVRKPVAVDGDLAEWDLAAGLVFHNNDNRLEVAAAWDRKYLYFAIRVKDKSLISLFHGSDSIQGDFVEIFLDAGHRHREFMDFQDLQFTFSANGSRTA